MRAVEGKSQLCSAQDGIHGIAAAKVGSANPFALIPFCHGIFGFGALVSICGGGSKED